MKIATATTLLFATLALASPAPVARPEAAPVAQSLNIENHDHFAATLVARIAALVPEIHARTTGGSGGGGGGKGSSTSSKASSSKPKAPKTGNSTTNAASSLTPSYTLQLGALGFAAVGVARHWA